MKKAIVLAFFLTTTLACSTTNQLFGGSNSSVGSNATAQIVPQKIANFQNGIATWNWNISNTIPDFNVVLSQGYHLHIWSPNANLGYELYFIDNGVVYFSDQNKQPTAIDLLTGKKIWQSDLQGSILGMGKNIIVVYRDDNRIYGLAKKSGEQVWKIIVAALVPEGLTLEPFPYLIPSQNDITVPMKSKNNNGFDEWNIQYLHINETNGDTRLTDYNAVPNIDTPYALVNNVVIAEDLSSLYGFSCTQGTEGIAGIDPTNGSKIWAVYPDQNNCLSILGTDTQNNVMYVLSPIGVASWFGCTTIFELNAIDMNTGNNIWGSGLLNKNHLSGSTPMCGNYKLTDKYIYFVTSNEIFAFQKDNGNLINRFPQERTFNSFFSENGDIVISYPDLGTTKGIDPISSQEIWNNDELVLSPITDPMVIGDIILFQDDNTQEVFALDVKTGKVLWKKMIAGFSSGYNTITFQRNFTTIGDVILYKDDRDTSVYLLNPNSGDNHILIDMPLDTRIIRPIKDDLWIVEFTGQLSLISLK